MNAHVRNKIATPSLSDYVQPAINEIEAVIKLMQSQVWGLTTCARLGKETTTAMQAEELAKTAGQIKGLAEAVHRGIAKRNGLEPQL